MPYTITGLDIGSFETKGIIAEKRKNGLLSVLSVFKHPTQGFRKGVLVDSEDATHMLREIVLDIQKVSKSAAKNIFVNINSEHVKGRISRGTIAVARADQTIQQDDIERVTQASRAVKFSPNYTVLHNIIREYFVDDIGDIADPFGMSGTRLEAVTLIVEVFAPHMTTLIKNLERAGAGIGGIVFNPLATMRAILTKRQKELGCVLIDFGADTTTMAVFEENKSLHVKSFPIGSSYITKDIGVGLKITNDSAEKLKIAEGCAFADEVSRKDIVHLSEYDSSVNQEISKRFLAEIIEARMMEILGLVQNELKAIGKQSRLPAGAIIIGGGVKLAGMAELVRQELKMSVQMGYPDGTKFEIMNPAHKELLDEPEFACAMGLILCGDESDTKRNFEIGPHSIKNFFKSLIP